MKRCSKCGEEKSFDAFSRRAAMRDGYRSQCKRCDSDENRARRAAHPDRNGASRRWYATHRERQKVRMRRYHADNRAKRLRQMQHWSKANAARNVAAAARYRALKANAPQGDPADAAAFSEILREGICELCGSHGPIHVDHIDALSTGGEHGWENFAGLCHSCNSAKKDKPLLIHMLNRGG